MKEFERKMKEKEEFEKNKSEKDIMKKKKFKKSEFIFQINDFNY